MSAKEAIEKANKLHAELMEAKKTHGIWWENYHSLVKKMNESNKLLHEGKIDIDAWKLVFGECLKVTGDVDAFKAPNDPDTRPWYQAHREAMVELAVENGLRSQID